MMVISYRIMMKSSGADLWQVFTDINQYMSWESYVGRDLS